MKQYFILSFFITVILFAGCTDPNQRNITEPVLNWNGYNYIVTNEPITQDQIEEKIGEITKETTVLPTKHEEGYRLKTGVNIYKIKGEEISSDIDSIMAIEIEGEFKVVRRIVGIN